MSKAAAKSRGKCLVLGGCGFIGSHIVEGLLASGYTVRVFDKVNVETRNIDHVLNNVELVEGDFTNEVNVAQAVKGVDYIFHFIGTTLPKTSTDNQSAIATLRPVSLPLAGTRSRARNSSLRSRRGIRASGRSGHWGCGGGTLVGTVPVSPVFWRQGMGFDPDPPPIPEVLREGSGLSLVVTGRRCM